MLFSVAGSFRLTGEVDGFEKQAWFGSSSSHNFMTLP